MQRYETARSSDLHYMQEYLRLKSASYGSWKVIRALGSSSETRERKRSGDDLDLKVMGFE